MPEAYATIIAILLTIPLKCQANALSAQKYIIYGNIFFIEIFFNYVIESLNK